MCRLCVALGKTGWRSHTAPPGSSSTTGHVTSVVTVAVEELYDTLMRQLHPKYALKVCRPRHFESKTSDIVWVVGTLFFLPKNCPYDHFSPADHSSFVVVVRLIPFSADDHTVTSRQCQKAQDPAGQTSSQLLHQIIHVAKPQPTVWRTAACRLLSRAYHHAVEPSQRTDTVLSVDIATVGCPVSIGCWHHNKINVPDTLASGSAHH